MKNYTKETKTASVKIRLTPTLHKKLMEHNVANDISASQLFRKLLTDYLN